ncbi:MAG: hypothetical protein V7642_7145 [Burkholderiales bacterium]
MKKLSMVLVVMLLGACSAMNTPGASDTAANGNQPKKDVFNSYIGGSK